MWSRDARRREPTLARQFLVLQLVVVGLLLLIVGVVSVRQSTATFTTERGSQLRAVGEALNNVPALRSGLDAADLPGSTPVASNARLAPLVERGLGLSGATSVFLVTPDGVVVAASDPSLLGKQAPLGDSDAMRGRSWTGQVDVGGQRVLAAHTPVLRGPQGRFVGLIVVTQAVPTTWQRLTDAGSNLALFLGLGALLGVLGSVVVSRLLARRTQGLGAAELARLADHREALLHSIREGVVAVDTDGRVTMVNDAALDLLGLSDRPDPVGRRVDELGLDRQVVDLLTGASGTTARDAVALVGTRVVVVNRRDASAGGRGIGSVTTMRDRTELVSVQQQLSTNLSITDTLRAQTHEFDNKLHVISGLVQLEEYDEVRTLIGDVTRRRSEIDGFVSARIDDPGVAALVVAKDAVATEHGVELRLDPATRLGALPPDLVADVTTVLGNLVDNAVDAVAGGDDPWVEVLVAGDGEQVRVRVSDHGPGVPDELRDAVFVRGFSTKPEVLGGRGIGLPLVRLISLQRGGRVSVGDRDGGGAVFEVLLPVSSVAAGVEGVEDVEQGVAR